MSARFIGSRMHSRDSPIHVIDFEGSRRSGILEYGVVTLRQGAVEAARTRLCRPLGRVDEMDIAVHRIRPAVAERFPPFSDEWGLFSELRKTGPLAAHFAGAENSLIKSVWPYPSPSPDFVRPGREINEWGPWIDTGRLYAEVFPGLESGNLQLLIQAFGYQEELDELARVHCPAERSAYHAALYDALAAAVLLLKLLERPEFADASLVWLLQMSAGRGPGRERISQRELFD